MILDPNALPFCLYYVDLLRRGLTCVNSIATTLALYYRFLPGNSKSPIFQATPTYVIKDAFHRVQSICIVNLSV